jgi:hypothetical protein
MNKLKCININVMDANHLSIHVDIIYQSMNIIHIALIHSACSKVLTREEDYNSA